MTEQEWIQRYIGAYAAFGGEVEDAEQAVLGYVNVNTDEDCPIESARADFAEDNESLVA